jgi:hypothetical protein
MICWRRRRRRREGGETKRKRRNRKKRSRSKRRRRIMRIFGSRGAGEKEVRARVFVARGGKARRAMRRNR